MKLVSIIYITFLLFISLTCGLDLPASDSIPYGNVNNYDPPRANPHYCQGFDIEYPSTPGLVFEIGSTQELHWAVNQSVSIVPDYIFRVRLMNSTQHAKYIINGVSRKSSIYV
jgi:hypothetical protein